MSINWVMLDSTGRGFINLPREKILFTSPNRVGLMVGSPNSFPGKQPISIKHGDGRAFVTNQRIVYLPEQATSTFQSLQIPLLSLQDTHVTAPFFGPNQWEGIFSPTANGGIQIPSVHGLVQLKLTFKDGGAFDFHSTYEQIREFVQQAAEMNVTSDNRVRLNENVIADLEQLPAYQASAAMTPSIVPADGERERDTSGTQAARDSTDHESPASPLPTSVASPEPLVEIQDHNTDAPPGYEESQVGAVTALTSITNPARP